jgi:hypothetical protein
MALNLQVWIQPQVICEECDGKGATDTTKVNLVRTNLSCLRACFVFERLIFRRCVRLCVCHSFNRVELPSAACQCGECGGTGAAVYVQHIGPFAQRVRST